MPAALTSQKDAISILHARRQGTDTSNELRLTAELAPQVLPVNAGDVRAPATARNHCRRAT